MFCIAYLICAYDVWSGKPDYMISPGFPDDHDLVWLSRRPSPALVWKTRHSRSGLDFQIHMLWSGFPDPHAFSWISRTNTIWSGYPDGHLLLWSGNPDYPDDLLLFWSGNPDTQALVWISRLICFVLDFQTNTIWSGYPDDILLL